MNRAPKKSILSKDYTNAPFWWENTPRPTFDEIELPKETEVIISENRDVELIYQNFNAARIDSIAFQAYKARMEGWIENRTARPENVFRDSIQVTKAQHHFRERPWSMDVLAEMNMQKSYRIFKARFADASDFTFFFVGSFDLDGMSRRLSLETLALA